MSTTRVITIDPSLFFHKGAQLCLSPHGYEILAHIYDRAGVKSHFGVIVPDLALVGPNFSDCEDLGICRMMIKQWPAVKLIIFTPRAGDPLFRVDAVNAGINACLLPGASEAESLAAIAAVMAGHQLFSRDTLAQAFRPLALTPKEHEVLSQLVKRKTDREIAQALGLSVATIRNHSQRILEKLGVHDRHEAVGRARCREMQ